MDKCSRKEKKYADERDCSSLISNYNNCLSFFYNDVKNKDWLLEKFQCFVNDIPDIADKNIYLIVIGYYGGSDRIKRYYKLWKAISKEYQIDGFVLGKEYLIRFQDKPQYCGVAKLGLKEIKIALDIIVNRQQSSFLLITNDEISEGEHDIKIGVMDIIDDVIIDCEEINLDKLYAKIRMTETIITISSDGEEIAIFAKGNQN